MLIFYVVRRLSDVVKHLAVTGQRPVTVSYTHLKSVSDLPFFYEQKWWNGRHAGFRHQFLAVSYTHLDVYKRQDMDGRLPLILDGGECDVGVESTVVSVVGEKPTLFRPCLLYTSRCV